jgi:hypothetical protein
VADVSAGLEPITRTDGRGAVDDGKLPPDTTVWLVR